PLTIPRLSSVRLMLLLTVNTRTELPPLIVTLWPEASRIVFAAMVLVLVIVIVPSQVKVMVPALARAAFKSDSVQLATTPSQRPACGRPMNPMKAKTSHEPRRKDEPTFR